MSADPCQGHCIPAANPFGRPDALAASVFPVLSSDPIPVTPDRAGQLAAAAGSAAGAQTQAFTADLLQCLIASESCADTPQLTPGQTPPAAANTKSTGTPAAE